MSEAPENATEPTTAAVTAEQTTEGSTTEGVSQETTAVAPSAAGTTTEKTTETESAPAAANDGTPTQQLFATAQAQNHLEIWGVTLANPDTHIPSQIVFQKYLNANDGDITKAKEQLIKTLQWRAQMKPLDLLKKNFSKNKFSNLGYVTSYSSNAGSPGTKEVFTWNIYGKVTSMEETFGNVNDFIEWRVALMELALQELSLSSATTPITETEDPYKIYQVHDYSSVSFFKQNPLVKSASKETISVFAQNYPELLKEKFFVNVPAIMGFMYGLMKMFVAPKTSKKFHPMSNGGALAKEFPDNNNLGEKLPQVYGGKGEALEMQGKTTLLE